MRWRGQVPACYGRPMSIPDPSQPSFADAPWNRLSDAMLARAGDVPTMLTPRERRLYVWLAAHWSRGAGAVVDLGCFVGGSTACLAQGLTLAGRDGLVHAYDRFTANESAKEKFLYAQGVPRFEGSDTLALARQLLAPWEGRIKLHRGDILEQRWTGEPVELLVVDIAKSTTIADHVAAQFFGAMIPGRSVLVHQDYFHNVQPWLPAQMEMLKDHFTPLAHIAPHSMCFLCTAVPEAEALESARTDALDSATMLRHLESVRVRHALPAADRAIGRMMDNVRAHPELRDAGALRRHARRPAGS